MPRLGAPLLRSPLCLSQQLISSPYAAPITLFTMFSLEKDYMDRLFSAERLTRFYGAAHQDAAEAFLLYTGNIQLSESLYASLAVA